MRIPRRTVLTGASGIAAAILAPQSSPGQQTAHAGDEQAAPQADLPPVHFANMNQPQRHQYTGLNDLAGRKRFAFLDTRQVRDIRDAELRFHAAEKHGDPVLVADPKQESGASVYGSVLHDGERFRMWYQSFSPGPRRANPYGVAYAESRDGVHWERPELGIVEQNSSKKNSLVNLRGHGPSVMDLGPDAPADKRYLGIAVGYAPLLGVPEVLEHESTRRHHGYWMYYSADGLRWHLYPPSDCAIFHNMSDTACFIHDPYRRRVIGSVKLEPRVRLFDRRSVTMTTTPSDNPTNWEPPRLTLFPDELDDRLAVERGCRFAEFYGMGLFAQRDYLIGFPEVYWVEGDLHPSQVAGVRLGYHGKAEIQMAYSFDGYAWHRTVPRKPFIELGKDGEWDDGFLMMQSSAVEVGDEVFFYYTGIRGGHSNPQGTSHPQIGLARIRRDRFASIGSDGRGMVEVYHGLRESQQLFVNGRTDGDGEIRVELRRPKGKGSVPVPGFTAADCTPIRGDDVRLGVGWKSESWNDLPASEVFVLRFHLANAEVFAYETT